jgi:hypothetical protein
MQEGKITPANLGLQGHFSRMALFQADEIAAC